MAFLTVGAPGTTEDEIGPTLEYEYRQWMVGPGFTWAEQVRSVNLYRCYYLCNDAGGEAPSATWVVDGDTYKLRSAGPELQYRDHLGLYVAVYEFTSV
jgi:hypothetical protein